MTEINFDLLTQLATKPHRLLKIREDHRHDCCPYDGEVFQEARNSHHLLDMAHIPAEPGYKSDLDARVWLAVTELGTLRDRLYRLAGWHSRESGPAGTFGDYCNECGGKWPCDTRRMAEGTYVDSGESDVPLPEEPR